jgi:hypothetical protein
MSASFSPEAASSWLSFLVSGTPGKWAVGRFKSPTGNEDSVPQAWKDNVAPASSKKVNFCIIQIYISWS